MSYVWRVFSNRSGTSVVPTRMVRPWFRRGGGEGHGAAPRPRKPLACPQDRRQANGERRVKSQRAAAPGCEWPRTSSRSRDGTQRALGLHGGTAGDHLGAPGCEARGIFCYAAYIWVVTAVGGYSQRELMACMRRVGAAHVCKSRRKGVAGAAMGAAAGRGKNGLQCCDEVAAGAEGMAAGVPRGWCGREGAPVADVLERFVLRLAAVGTGCAASRCLFDVWVWVWVLMRNRDSEGRGLVGGGNACCDGPSSGRSVQRAPLWNRPRVTPARYGAVPINQGFGA